jgi:hypothetical protein
MAAHLFTVEDYLLERITVSASTRDLPITDEE